jgi:serine/threonine protein kinase
MAADSNQDDAGRRERSAVQDRAESDDARAPVALPEGTQLREEYRVGAVLGVGHFGITYRAHDQHLDTTVAIKEYYPRQIAERSGRGVTVRSFPGDDEEFSFGLHQFMQEGRTVARLEHPNIVDVRSYFEENGTGYLVMDHYEGDTLAAYLDRQGGILSEAEALSLMRDVLRGLGMAHAKGVLHRDVGPKNVYRTSAERAVLIDFGAAREAVSARRGQLSEIVTPGYAPLEQYSSEGDQGPHTDIYAAAATLYKCLTGTTPLDATERVEDDDLVPPRAIRPEISVETSEAIMAGLALEPDQRPPSVRGFAALLGDEGDEDRGDGPPPEAGSSSTLASGPEPALDGTPTDIREPEDPSEERGLFLDAEAEGTATQAPSETSTLSLVGLLTSIWGIVGGALLYSEAGSVEILAFFGTWMAVCVGVVGLFREGEKVMSAESRAAVSDWLLEENFAERHSNWPGTFVALFDALFTREHLSWTCFRRSAITSVLVVTVLFAGFAAVGLITIPTTVTDLAEIAVLLGLPVALNIVIDYVSLFETRWVLGQMSATDHTAEHVGYLGLDLVLTALCVVLPVSVLQIFGLGVMTEFSAWTAAFWYQLGSALLNMMELFVTVTAEGLGEIPRVMSVMLFSTMFTSVWVWLYAAAGGVLRTFRPVLESLDWLKRHLNVESRPVHAMGMFLALLISLAFAVTAPFVL